MPNNSVPGQIISELGQIAKDVEKQTAQVPKDIAGKAMESLGAASGKTPQGTNTSKPVATGGEQTAWEKIDTEGDVAVKRAIARKALEDLVGGVARKKEPSIWEKLMAEQEQKKQQATMQQAAAASAQLPQTGSKRPPGDLYGAKAKKTATENRSIRQD